MNDMINHQRLANHMISSTNSASPLEVTSLLGALQAQDYEAALWAIGIRCGRDTTREDVQTALNDGKIVRTWLMRGTLHISASEDVRWLIEPTRAGLLRTAASHDKHLGLSQDMIEKSRSLLFESLKGGKSLTRSEAYKLFDKIGIPAKNNIGYHMLYRAAWDGLICFGPQEGKEQTVVLLDEWVPESRAYHVEDVLKELAVRYFSGHGPATVRDFVWWSGIKASEARKGIEKARQHLIEDEVDGNVYYSARAKKKQFGDGVGTFLLPAFDEYIIGYRDRSIVIGEGNEQGSGRAENSRFVHSNGVFLPTVISDGMVIGTWKKQVKAGRVRLVIEPFEKMEKDFLPEIREAVDDYGRFLGVDPQLVY